MIERPLIPLKPLHITTQTESKMPSRARIRAAAVLLLLAVAAVRGFAPVGVHRPTTQQQERRWAVSGSSDDAWAAASFFAEAPIVMSAAAASSGAASRPTAGGAAATRPLKKRSKSSAVANNYGFIDFLIGPLASDCKLAGVPSELLPFASDLHRATGHLPRRDRVQALVALTTSYHLLRKHHSSSSRSSSSSSSSRYGGQQRGATLGATVEQMVSVGVLLGQSDVDGAAIAAALLCPCAAVGCLDPAVVEAEFGGEVAGILKGLQAMHVVESQLEIKSLINEYSKFLWGSQGDHLRNLLLVVAKDWRAVALRVAWKKVELDSRRFGSKKEEIDACWAALNIYASLAEKAGMSLVKAMIEERAFKFLMPSEYAKVHAQLEARGEQHRRVLQQARQEVMRALLEDGAFMNAVERVEVKGRIKAPYSVWKKSKARNCSVDELFDMIALRVVVTPLPEPAAEKRAATGAALCRYVLQLVHKTRPHVPGRVKDYISAPKENGYQSLHTTLALRMRGKAWPVEVQIRTAEQHAVAEHGLAAHALYKGDRTLEDVINRPEAAQPQTWASRGDWLTWCQRVLEQSHVIVFDPDGRLVRLKKGSTLLDFLKIYYGSVGAIERAASSQRHGGGRSRRSQPVRAAGSSRREEVGGLLQRRKRSQSGTMLINGQTASSLDRELCTGDVITSL